MYFLRFPGFLGLPFQVLEPWFGFPDYIVYTYQVGAGFVQTVEGQVALLLVGGNARGFLEQDAPFLRPKRKRSVHQSLADDGVSSPGEAALGKELHDVLQSGSFPVQTVFRFSRPVNPPGYLDFIEFDREPFLCVVQDEGDRGHPYSGTEFASRKDQIFGAFGSEQPVALLPQRPSDCVGNVGFSASVRPDYCRDSAVEDQVGFGCKCLEPLEFELSQPQCLPSISGANGFSMIPKPRALFTFSVQSRGLTRPLSD